MYPDPAEIDSFAPGDMICLNDGNYGSAPVWDQGKPCSVVGTVNPGDVALVIEVGAPYPLIYGGTDRILYVLTPTCVGHVLGRMMVRI